MRRPVVASSPSRAALGPHTWDEFVALPDHDRRELIEGELVEVEVPDLAHEHVAAKLSFYLCGWAEANGGAVLAPGHKVRIGEGRGVTPDVQVFRAGNAATGRPDLSIEVISPSGRGYDCIIKLGYYASVGVPEYWLVDPRTQLLERLVLARGAYRSAEIASGESVLAPASFAGLSIPLAKVWLAATAPMPWSPAPTPKGSRGRAGP